MACAYASDWAATRGRLLKERIDRRDRVRWRLCAVCGSLLEEGAVYLHQALRHPGDSSYCVERVSPFTG